MNRTFTVCSNVGTLYSSILLVIRNTFPSSTNDCSVNDFDATVSVWGVSLHMSPRLCSALILLLALCAGLDCEPSWCRYKKKWKRRGGSHMQSRGSLGLEPLAPWSPRMHCYKNRLLNGREMALESGRPHYLTCSALGDEAGTWVKTNVPGIMIVLFLSSAFCQ